MKLVTLAPLVVALGCTCEALSLSTLGDLWKQLPLFSYDRPQLISEQLNKVAQYLGKSVDDVPTEIQKIWADLELDLGSETVSKGWQKAQGVVDNTVKPRVRKVKPKTNWLYNVQNEELPNYSLRIKSPLQLGIDDVKQYSGYIDIEDEDKHLFYWFFESRNDPKNDPIILWLNGGPGCSSMTGLFFELGPASIDRDIQVVHNPYSWNNNASVIFLDQPVNVGFSYSSKSVSSTVAAGKDVYAFLNLFFQQFPEYSSQEFHIAGESYAGHYIPEFATEILKHPERNFNFTSALIGNGITDSLIQYGAYEPMACGKGGYKPVIKPEECDLLKSKYPKCAALAQVCYDNPNTFSCLPASIYCETLMDPYAKTGLNYYDMRIKMFNSSEAYEENTWSNAYLNQEFVQEAIGAEVDTFEDCSNSVFLQFGLTADGPKPFQGKVAELLETDIPVLIYAGDKDYICNWLGNRAWTHALEWSGSDEFINAPVRKWKVDGVPAGTAQNSGIFTFLRVYDAGHMVPFNQPKHSLDMVNRWISGDYVFK